ncbi:MAG: hypothetical protein ABUU24_00720, partial [Variovorax sp.]
MLALNALAQLLLKFARPLRLLAWRSVLAFLLRAILLSAFLFGLLPAVANRVVALLLDLTHLPIPILAHATRERFTIEHRRSRRRGRIARRPIYTRAIRTRRGIRTRCAVPLHAVRALRRAVERG